MKDWCTTIKQLVIDSGKKLVEEVKLSPNPEKLKFIKNEDIRTLVNQGKVGFLTAVPAPPDVSPSNSQFRKKEGLTTIKEDEDEVSFCVACINVIYNLTLRSLESSPAGQWALL